MAFQSTHLVHREMTNPASNRNYKQSKQTPPLSAWVQLGAGKESGNARIYIKKDLITDY